MSWIARLAVNLLIAAVPALLPSGAFAQATCQPPLGHPPLLKPGVLVAAINPTVPPIQYTDDSGRLAGLDVAFGNMIAARLCLKMDFVSTQFATMIPGLKEGRFDMIDTFMYYTPDRAAQVIMIPYGAATLSIVVPAANHEPIGTIDFFSGKPFGVQLGSIDEREAHAASAALVAAGKPPIDIHSFPNYSDILQTLRAGQIAGGFVVTEQAYYYRQKGLNFFRIATAGLYPHAEALAFQDRDLAGRVADALNALHADGSFQKLFGAYHACTLPPPYRITTGPIAAPDCPARPE